MLGQAELLKKPCKQRSFHRTGIEDSVYREVDAVYPSLNCPSLTLVVRLSLPLFGGEPDGSLFFAGQGVPFFWLKWGARTLKENPCTYGTLASTSFRAGIHCFANTSDRQMHLGVSIKINREQRIMLSLMITPCHYSTAPSVSTFHGGVICLLSRVHYQPKSC
jgi:hypothetical protein